jgi:hypothetical protein
VARRLLALHRYQASARVARQGLRGLAMEGSAAFPSGSSRRHLSITVVSAELSYRVM